MSNDVCQKHGFHKANLKRLFSVPVKNYLPTSRSASCDKLWTCKFYYLSFCSQLIFKSHFSAVEYVHVSTQECIQKQISSWSLFISEHNESALAANAHCVHRTRLELVQHKLFWKRALQWAGDSQYQVVCSTVPFLLCYRVHKCECTAIISSRMFLYLGRLRFICLSTSTGLD